MDGVVGSHGRRRDGCTEQSSVKDTQRLNVGLILDRAERKALRDEERDANNATPDEDLNVDKRESGRPKSERRSSSTNSPLTPSRLSSTSRARAASFVSESMKDPYKDELLDFPECDGILNVISLGVPESTIRPTDER